MRQISAGGLAKLSTKLGTEPINVIEVDWGGSTLSYADKETDGIPGKILSMGSIDNVVNVQRSGSSQAVTVTLDDTDGALKSILDNVDVHQVDARVYQHFGGMPIGDKFLLFSGKVSSPITWREGDRTLTFTIISQIEDLEFGFSPEEGQITGLPSDMIGEPWPVVFGTVADVPAVAVKKAVRGSTLCGVGILSGQDAHLAAPLGPMDCNFLASASTESTKAFLARQAASLWLEQRPAYAAGLIQRAVNIETQLNTQIARASDQQACAATNRAQTLETALEEGEGCNPVRIIGGEDFPQNQEITLNIGGGLFTGVMSGQDFTISARTHLQSEELVAQRESRLAAASCNPNQNPVSYFEVFEIVPDGMGDIFYPPSKIPPTADNAFNPRQNYISRYGYHICEDTSRIPNLDEILAHFWAEAGSSVTVADGETIAYVASIVPGTVLDVRAYKQFESERQLISLPAEYYTVQNLNLGSITAKLILLSKPLSARTDEGWSDDLYVTYQSDIGPEIGEIIEWIVDNYTDLTVDTDSLTAVGEALESFPCNFAVLDRRNTLDILRQIAFDTRCALWINNGVVHMKYLPTEPDADLTITVSDIELGSVEVSTTDTEELITKMTVQYTTNYADLNGEKIILRNNVGKYGTKEQSYTWMAYSAADLVYHAASFWALRQSTSWKRIAFDGFLPLLRLETFDTVLLDLPPYVANGPVKAVVESADYDSNSNSVHVECLIPVVSGAMQPHPLFWPQNATVPYPTQYDQPGGSGIGSLATGVLPIGNINYLLEQFNSGGVFVGGPNTLFKGQSDRGTTTMWDTDFVASEVVIPEAYVGLDPLVRPELDLGIDWIPSPEPVVISVDGSSTAETAEGVIDIRNTTVIDSDTGDEAPLSDILRWYADGNTFAAAQSYLLDDE